MHTLCHLEMEYRMSDLDCVYVEQCFVTCVQVASNFVDTCIVSVLSSFLLEKGSKVFAFRAVFYDGFVSANVLLYLSLFAW